MALKWGVLGAGSVAQRRAMPAITKAEDAELYALLSRDGVRAQRLATEHGAQKYYTTVEELLSDEALDAIYVSTPVYLHCEQVIEAAERGFHVLCDKPMAMNTAECRTDDRCLPSERCASASLLPVPFPLLFSADKELGDGGPFGRNCPRTGAVS